MNLGDSYRDERNTVHGAIPWVGTKCRFDVNGSIAVSKTECRGSNPLAYAK